MAHAEIPEVTLYDNTHCPFSERARRALGEKGIYQHRIGFRWHLRSQLAAATGYDTVPVLLEGGRFIAGSGAIARHAEHMGSQGLRLFPDKHRRAIAAWERRGNEMVDLTMPLVIPVWAAALADPEEREAFLACHHRFGDRRDLEHDELHHWNTVMAAWRELDAALEGRDYLLGPLTYADFAIYGSVYVAAQFHAFEVPAVLQNLAAWYEAIRTEGIMRDQELILGRSRQGHGDHDIDYTRSTTRYGDPPHHPEDSGRQTY